MTNSYARMKRTHLEPSGSILSVPLIQGYNTHTNMQYEMNEAKQEVSNEFEQYNQTRFQISSLRFQNAVVNWKHNN